MHRTSLSALLIAGCTVPPAAHAPFLPPVALETEAATDVGVSLGGDAMLDGYGRHVFILSEHTALDLGGGIGPAYTGGSGGLWLRTRESKKGRSGGVRLGAAAGFGSSKTTTLIMEGSAPSLGEPMPMYAGGSLHFQLGWSPERRSGRFSLLLGAGMTAYPFDSYESFFDDEVVQVNLNFDLSLRYDRPSGLFMGVGLQPTSWILYPIPALTLGHHF